MALHPAPADFPLPEAATPEQFPDLTFSPGSSRNDGVCWSFFQGGVMKRSPAEMRQSQGGQGREWVTSRRSENYGKPFALCALWASMVWEKGRRRALPSPERDRPLPFHGKAGRGQGRHILLSLLSLQSPSSVSSLTNSSEKPEGTWVMELTGSVGAQSRERGSRRDRSAEWPAHTFVGKSSQTQPRSLSQRAPGPNQGTSSNKAKCQEAWTSVRLII